MYVHLSGHSQNLGKTGKTSLPVFCGIYQFLVYNPVKPPITAISDFIPVMAAEALVAVTVEVLGLAPVVEEAAEDAGFFEGVLRGVFGGVFEGVVADVDDDEGVDDDVEVGLSVLFSFPTWGVAGGV